MSSKGSVEYRIKDVLGCPGILKETDVSDRIFFYPQFSDQKITIQIVNWNSR